MNNKQANRYDADTTAKLVLELRDKGLSKEEMLDLKARCKKLIEHIDWNLSSEKDTKKLP